jgi:CRISPR-associated endonuclease/helicase Cas3
MMAKDPELSPEHFGAFYRELYPKREPYLWHERAARELADGTAWRDDALWSALYVPTGMGKTTLIECFLFALACTRGRARIPRRLFWVVDRRSVVDQVYLHAREVTEKIEAARSKGPASVVRTRLEELAASTTPDAPIQTRLWRGGFVGEALLDAREDDESEEVEDHRQGAKNAKALLRSERLRAPLSPCAVAIVCTTVDQIGSRLLFRGYGVSRRSRPVEAALVGTNSLIVLDEAHLSGPFHATGEAVAHRQRRRGTVDDLRDVQMLRGVQVLPVTATHTRRHLDGDHEDSQQHRFELTPTERNDPVLAFRTAARRPTTLEKGHNPLLTCAKAARRCAEEGAQVIGVIANTVAGARQIAATVRADGETILIVGPSRPLDRAGLLDRIPDRDTRSEDDRPLFVVGTQTLEVGLDIDFDALITECAPLSSLVQRLGRLDRAGQLTAGGKPGRGVIVQPPSDGCPVYGSATIETWKHLVAQQDTQQLDFSAERVAKMLAQPLPGTQIDEQPPPRMEPWHIEMLAQTSDPLAPEPDVAVFLRGEHGLGTTDVSVCWRADLTHDTRDTWEQRIAIRPPHTGELVSLPAWSARRWLSQKRYFEDGPHSGDFSDIEGGNTPESVEDAQPPRTSVVRVPPPDYDGDIHPETIDPGQIQPGDVIVVPASIGGCDEFGWNPDSHRAVTDLGNLSQSRPRVLLSKTVGTTDNAMEQVREIHGLLAAEELTQEEAYEQLLPVALAWMTAGTGHDTTPADETARTIARRLGHASTGKAIPIGASDRSTSTDLLLLAEPTRHERPTHAVLYADHAREVEVRVREFADSLNLDSELTATLATAARHHDLGKLDRRFQAWLNGGSSVGQPAPLAKSASGPGNPQSWAARRDAMWPRGKRHEMISAALLAQISTWPQEIDRDLLLHLVATHHGDGRPFRDHAPDPEPIDVTATVEGHDLTVRSDFAIPWPDHAHRFAALNERFGPWGLAAIESLLVLADRGVSAEPLNTPPPPLPIALTHADGSHRPSKIVTHSIPLIGLRAENPLAFLGAIGVLSLLDRSPNGERRQMAWQAHQGTWVPLLHTTDLEQPSDVLDALAAAHQQRDLTLELGWDKDIMKITREDLRALLVARAGEEDAARMVGACLGELPLRRDGVSAPYTPLRLIPRIGRSRFLDTALRESNNGVEHLESCLFEDWRYTHDTQSMRWDPAARVPSRALMAEAPTHAKPSGVQGAVLLAMRGLTSFPLIIQSRTAGPSSGGRVFASAMPPGMRDRSRFLWPIWEQPLALPLVRMLLSSRWLYEVDADRSTRSGDTQKNAARQRRRRLNAEAQLTAHGVIAGFSAPRVKRGEDDEALGWGMSIFVGKVPRELSSLS